MSLFILVYALYDLVILLFTDLNRYTVHAIHSTRMECCSVVHCFSAMIVLTWCYGSIDFSHGLFKRGWPPQIAFVFLNECPIPLNWEKRSVK